VLEQLRTILVVEDESGIRSLVRSILESQGYAIIEAESGAKALELWPEQGRRIELLLSDIMMPGGVSGLDLARNLIAQKPGLKIVFTSAYSADVFQHELGAIGKHSFLQKPYYPHELIKMIREALNGAGE